MSEMVGWTVVSGYVATIERRVHSFAVAGISLRRGVSGYWALIEDLAEPGRKKTVPLRGDVLAGWEMLVGEEPTAEMRGKVQALGTGA